MKKDTLYVMMAVAFFVFVVFVMPSTCDNSWDAGSNHNRGIKIRVDSSRNRHDRLSFKDQNPDIDPRVFRERIIREVDEAGFPLTRNEKDQLRNLSEKDLWRVIEMYSYRPKNPEGVRNILRLYLSDGSFPPWAFPEQ